MSKKDYIAIARILKNSETIPEVAAKLADYFARDNPRFNRERFMQAQFSPERRDEIDIANASAHAFANTLLFDDGHGEMSPGPCADALTLVRKLKWLLRECAGGISLDSKLGQEINSVLERKDS